MPAAPYGITAGPDGNLWFTDVGNNAIGQITTSGSITEFPIHTANSVPYGITAGPDGNLWFTEAGGNKIGHITTTGNITPADEFPIHTANSFPTGITTGPDGNLWFTESNGNQIGRVNLKFLTLSANPSHVWANGRKQATLTATLQDANGNPVANQTISLAANPPDALMDNVDHTCPSPADQAAGQPCEVTTDGLGVATFTATSVKAEPITFTATDTAIPSIADSTDVQFQRHKIVIQFLGINTSLTSGSPPSSDDGFAYFPDGTQNPLGIRPQLISQQGFAAEDFLWYSYRGGSVDADGQWSPSPYTCVDATEGYQTAIQTMTQLINNFGMANPNTDFYLVGHSQGGLIALQEVAFLNALPPKTTVQAIFTMDSPLGGAPQKLVDIVAGKHLGVYLNCWNFADGPAPKQQIDIWNTASGSTQQASNATLACLVPSINACSPSSLNGANSNSAAVVFARNQGTTVYTFGSLDDAVYRPEACNLVGPSVGGGVDNTSSETVNSALGVLDSLGNDMPLPPPISNLKDLILNKSTVLSCIDNSHRAVMQFQADSVVNDIGPQYQ